MKLVVIEAPGKVKSYNKILGSGYKILPTQGHFVDLPEKSLAVDIKKDFKPTFEVQKPDIEKSLSTAAKAADEIFLMLDEDREGEAIAWHVQNVIQKHAGGPIRRATTNAITKKGVQDAMKNSGDIDMGKIEAYLSRRILDRLAGYKTSFLTQQATGGRSAGRVQSAMLRLIADREQEILDFVPEEYWVLTAHFSSPKKERYTGVLSDKIKVPDEKTATEIHDKVIKGDPVVTAVETKEVNVNPYPPFTTLPMIASASTILGFTAKRTMKAAQSLYEAGHITYMRTDSPHMDPSAVDAIRSFISETCSTDYLPATPNKYAAKKGAQEAHECCRPTDVTAHLNLTGDEKKLYELIWRRAISSQMTPGRDRRVKVTTKVGGYDFVSNGVTRLFDGFRKVWTYGKSEDMVLPDLKKGDKCNLVKEKFKNKEGT